MRRIRRCIGGLAGIVIWDPTKRATELRQRILESMTPQELVEYARECLRSQRAIAESIASSAVAPIATEVKDGDPPGLAGGE